MQETKLAILKFDYSWADMVEKEEKRRVITYWINFSCKEKETFKVSAQEKIYSSKPDKLDI